MNDRTEEFLEKIRSFDGLSRAILCGITVSKRLNSAEFFLVTDRPYKPSEESGARKIAEEFVPDGMTATVKIVKRTPDRDILRERIYAFVCNRFPAASAFLKAEDVETEVTESGANFCFDIASGEQGLFTSGNVLDEVSAYLQTVFCGAFYGNVKIVEKQREDVEADELPVAETLFEEARFFPIVDFSRLDGADEKPTRAKYIADTGAIEDDLVVCGAITFIQEKQSKKGNTYFSLTINDGTGSLRASYFPKKATIEKVRTLKIGDSVVLSGANEEFNGSVSFSAKKINFGNPPEGWTPQKKKGKPIPALYKTIRPEPYVDFEQTGFFDDLSKPSDLKENVFVVFDLETTGLNNQPATGKMDKIIEIGAVKMIGGEIKERFASFIACPDKLPPEIVSLTGIKDEDLVGAPTIEEAIPDFFKFVADAYLVGHNVQFDYRFIRYYGEACGYMFENREFDTMTLSQELLAGQVSNYKLNTIAEHYGFSFNHHRAFEDAATTAKIFAELIKKRGSLPK